MIQRKAMLFLAEWKKSEYRKPLIIRGARQVGKTTLVKEFAKQYDVFLDLNLEKPADRQLFEDYDNVHELLTAIFYIKKREKRARQSCCLLTKSSFQNELLLFYAIFTKKQTRCMLS
jgi:predicted AAA+ superfamily ATPase